MFTKDPIMLSGASIILFIVNIVRLASGEVQSRLTPLIIDKIACRPEYLEVTYSDKPRYITNNKKVT